MQKRKRITKSKYIASLQHSFYTGPIVVITISAFIVSLYRVSNPVEMPAADTASGQSHLLPVITQRVSSGAAYTVAELQQGVVPGELSAACDQD